jgi:hypothetical protein
MHVFSILTNTTFSRCRKAPKDLLMCIYQQSRIKLRREIFICSHNHIIGAEIDTQLCAGNKTADVVISTHSEAHIF